MKPRLWWSRWSRVWRLLAFARLTPVTWWPVSWTEERRTLFAKERLRSDQVPWKWKSDLQPGPFDSTSVWRPGHCCRPKGLNLLSPLEVWFPWDTKLGGMKGVFWPITLKGGESDVGCVRWPRKHTLLNTNSREDLDYTGGIWRTYRVQV